MHVAAITRAAVFLSLLILLALADPANAARFSLLHSSFDGGGGTGAAGRFTSEFSITPFGGGGHVALLNESPTAGKDLLELTAAGTFAIAIADLLGNDFDLEGNSAALSLLQTNTTRGGFLVLSNGVLFYTPPASADPRGDSFEYAVSDSFGAASVGKVILAAPGAAPRLGEVRLAGANIELSFRALANETYMLQSRATLGGRVYWLDYPAALGPMIEPADAGGIVRFVVPIEEGNRFFRAVDVESLANELGIKRGGGQLTISLRGLPDTGYKLQMRSALEPGLGWQDYPSATRPFTIRSASDGIYQFAVPMLDMYGFFRTIPR